MLNEDTIAAAATPPGAGAIGIVRISGPAAEGIAGRLFKPRFSFDKLESHRLYQGDIVSPETGNALDEVLITLMKKPRSYTGEDIIEIHCHGGPVTVQAILSEVIRAGARLAEPGEFTKRAFLNGRMDLCQAEAVIDMINARTEQGASLALSHLKGGLREKIEAARSTITEILAEVEVALDFSDEVDEQPHIGKMTARLQAVNREMNDLLATYREGRAYRQGISVVIAGRTNVGKSSLMNRLLGEKRVIVTPVPGTTRDFIEEYISIKGLPVRVTDTAGIRDTQDAIEKEGIDLVWERMAKSDIIVAVFDGSEPLTPDDLEIIDKATGHPVIPVINKTDLPHRLNEGDLQPFAEQVDPLRISAKFGEGIDALRETIHTLAIGCADEKRGDVILTNMRHKLALETATYFLGQALAGIIVNRSPELVAYDLRDALDGLGEIAGKTTTEDVLNRIFSAFCIGK